MHTATVLGPALAFLAAACGGGGGGGGSDGGAIDAGPISAPEKTWTWIQMPGTSCANGTPAGFAINLNRASDELVYYFEGGGACFDGNSCFNLKIAARIGSNDDTLDITDFNALRPGLQASKLFDRNDPTSPFADATYVYMPYCTGDLYSGDRTEIYDHNGTPRTVHHQGGRNTKVVLDALHATLPALTHIWDLGSSAGGYGATLNHHNFVATWPAAQVDLLGDCSPFLPVIDSANASYALWQAHWSMEFPPSCAGCATSFPAIVDAVVANNPTSRVALLAYDQDAVIKAYFGYTDLAAAVATLLAEHYAQPTTHAFVLSSAAHTMLGNYATVTQPGGITLMAWVKQWATGDATWATVP